MTIFEKILGLLTLAAAFYGAILSTLNLRHSIRKRLLVRLVNLSISPSFEWIYLYVTNDSQNSIYIEAPLFITPSKKAYGFALKERNEYPYEIEPQNSYSNYINQHHLKTILKNDGYSGDVEIKALALDQTGKKYYSKPYIIDLEQISKIKNIFKN